MSMGLIHKAGSLRFFDAPSKPKKVAVKTSGANGTKTAPKKAAPKKTAAKKTAPKKAAPKKTAAKKTAPKKGASK